MTDYFFSIRWFHRTIYLFGFLMIVHCSGSSGSIRLEGIDKQISFSPFLSGNSGYISEGNGLRKVEDLEIQVTHWAILYTGIDLSNPDEAIAERINQELHSVGGDGIVNFSITVRNHPISQFPVLTWFPIWPTASTIIVKGDIVRK